MKSLITGRGFVFALFALFIVGGCSRPGEKGGAGKIYTCSMHPQIRQDHPGRCPICGMTLTLLRSGAPVPVTEPAAPAVTEVPQSPETPVPAKAVQLMPDQAGDVRTVVAGPLQMDKTVQIFGEMAYIMDQHRDFSWFYPGRVEQLLIHYNATKIKAGEPLLEIYSEEAIADQQAYLQALRDRYLTTFYERKVADAQVSAMKAKLVQAGFTDGELKDMVEKRAIKRTLVLRAPRAGTLVGSMPHVGERMNADQVLFHIVDLRRIWFVGQVFEQDLGNLKIGQAVEIETKAHPGRKFPGKLVFIDRIADEKNRTVMVRFEVDNADEALLPKLSGTGLIKVEMGEAAVTVPSSAVIYTGTRHLSYVETTPHAYEQREVVVGRAIADSVEITSGIKAGEKVVAGGAFLIDAEAQLRGVGRGASK